MFGLVRQQLIKQSVNFQISRTFLTNQQLGIDRFLYVKERTTSTNKETVIANVKKSIEQDGFVYTDDLKSLAYLADTPEDAKLLKDAFIKFASTDQPIRLNTFKIGPVVSRALYQNDDIESLKELFENEKTADYFNLSTSYNVYLSFLYKKERYAEVLDVGDKMFDTLFNNQDKYLNNRGLYDNALIVYLAAANKISSKEALDRSRKILHKYGEKISTSRELKKNLRLKQVMLYHLLCIKNNELNEALEVLSTINIGHYEFLNAKASILIKLGRADECLATLNKILEPDNNKAKYIFTETIETIKQELEKNPHDELKAKIDSLTQDVILDAKIEEAILALPNINYVTAQNKFQQQSGFRRFGGNNFRSQFSSNFNNRSNLNNRFGGNRFNNQDGGGFNRGGFNRSNNFGDDREGRNFGDNRDNRNFGDNRDGRNFNRFNNNNRFDNDFSDGSRRQFRPFQTRFRDQESSDFI